MMSEGLRRELTFFDAVSLVIGTIVGADIYIVAAYGAGSLGPASILSWIIGGLMAMVLALVFSEASAIMPRTGGPYSYAMEALGEFAGFITGWSLWVSSWIAIAVFPVAFVYYLSQFIGLSPTAEALIKVIFILSLTAINISGVGRAGKVNDVLTVLKVAPPDPAGCHWHPEIHMGPLRPSIRLHSLRTHGPRCPGQRDGPGLLGLCGL